MSRRTDELAKKYEMTGEYREEIDRLLVTFMVHEKGRGAMAAKIAQIAYHAAMLMAVKVGMPQGKWETYFRGTLDEAHGRMLKPPRMVTMQEVHEAMEMMDAAREKKGMARR